MKKPPKRSLPEPRWNTMKRSRLPKPVTLTLPEGLVNKLVAYASIVAAAESRWAKMTTIQQISLINALDEGEGTIGKLLVRVWESQYPQTKFVMPAIRDKADFDANGVRLPQKAKKPRR